MSDVILPEGKAAAKNTARGRKKIAGTGNKYQLYRVSGETVTVPNIVERTGASEAYVLDRIGLHRRKRRPLVWEMFHGEKESL